jgi:hypothetical protein
MEKRSIIKPPIKISHYKCEFIQSQVIFVVKIQTGKRKINLIHKRALLLAPNRKLFCPLPRIIKRVATICVE